MLATGLKNLINLIEKKYCFTVNVLGKNSWLPWKRFESAVSECHGPVCPNAGGGEVLHGLRPSCEGPWPRDRVARGRVIINYFL